MWYYNLRLKFIIIFVLCITAATLIGWMGCSGGGSGDDANENNPGTSDLGYATVGTDALTSGLENVLVGASFVYIFPKDLDLTTVSEDALYIMPYTDGTCNASDGIAASISCDSGTTCMLLPTSYLEQCTRYSLCVSDSVKFSDGTSYPGNAINFNTICCSELFGGPCTFTSFGEYPDESTTFTYSDLQRVVEEFEGKIMPSTGPYCLCELAYRSGLSTCFPFSEAVLSAETCGLNVEAAPGVGVNKFVHVIGFNLDAPFSQGQIYTVPEVTSEEEIFCLYFQYSYDAENGEDMSGALFGLYATEEERYCYNDCQVIGNLRAGVLDSGTGHYVGGECVTRADVGAFLSARGKMAVYDAGQCVDIWFEWDVGGLDRNFEEDGMLSTDLLHLRIQKSVGACT